MIAYLIKTTLFIYTEPFFLGYRFCWCGFSRYLAVNKFENDEKMLVFVFHEITDLILIQIKSRLTQVIPNTH